VATSYNNIGVVYERKGDYDNALLQHHRALEIRTRVFGSEHPSVADTKVNIGLVYEKTGKKSEAKTLFTEAAEIRRAKLGPDHPDTKKAERLAAQ